MANSVLGWEHINPLLGPDGLASFNGTLDENALTVCANQSISWFGVKKILKAFSALCIAISAFSVLQGNVMAPIFLLVNLAIVSIALTLAAKATETSDSLCLESDFSRPARESTHTEAAFLSGSVVQNVRLQLVRTRAGRVAAPQLLSGWVRCEMQNTDGDIHVCLRTSATIVEIGSFLNTEQRKRMGAQVKTFIDLANARVISTLSS
jgi:uncharacterized membrane protein